MSYLTPPQNVTGSVITLNNPGTVQNNVSPVAVQIRNASGYVLTVVGTKNQMIDPYTATTIAIATGENLVITPSFNAYTNLQSGYLSAEWLISNEKPSEPDGPLTSAATVAAINGNVPVINPNANGNALVSLGTAASISVADYGTGADGPITISANTTMTKDMNATTLVINNGVTLKSNGYVIRATTSVVNNGTIDNSATNSTTTTVGTPGAAGTLAGGANGVLVHSGATATAGVSPTSATFEGGNGGSVALTGTNIQGGTTQPFPITFNALLSGGTVSGGASGGAISGVSGSVVVSGSGGGAVVIFAPSISGSGTISVNGGNAADDNTGTNGAAGGGGGGIIALITASYTHGMTYSMTGGTRASNGSGTANNGSSGNLAIYALTSA